MFVDVSENNIKAFFFIGFIGKFNRNMIAVLLVSIFSFAFLYPFIVIYKIFAAPSFSASIEYAGAGAKSKIVLFLKFTSFIRLHHHKGCCVMTRAKLILGVITISCCTVSIAA